MKIICDREKLLGAFQTAASVAPSRSPKPILQNIKLTASTKGDEGIATLMATDTEVGVRLEVPGMQVESPGSVILPVSRFGPILRESNDETITIETDGSSISVKGQRSRFKLPAENPDEFPEVAVFDEKKYHEIPARMIKELVKRTLFATDNESSRYALEVCFWSLTTRTLSQSERMAEDWRKWKALLNPSKAILRAMLRRLCHREPCT